MSNDSALGTGTVTFTNTAAASNVVVAAGGSYDVLVVGGGGQGAVREILELILKTQGRWSQFVEHYSK